ncbi:hypothetical protein AAC387_Pa06g2437 [Persea americana]
MKITNPWPFFILYLALFPFSSKISIAAQDKITSSTSLSADDTLISLSSTFELGFFTRGNSTYLGICSLISRLVLNRTGHIQRYTWDGESGGSSWKLYWSAPKDQCDEYSKCGPYGICNVDSPSVCECVKGFEPKTPKELSLGVTSAGCVRKAKLECSGDGFLKLTAMKLPDSPQAFVNSSMSLEDCRVECLNNCSCVAYASADIASESGCIRWASDLIDLKQFLNGGQDLYIRLPASELGHFKGKKTLLATILSVVSVVLLFFLCGYYYWWKMKKGYNMTESHGDIFNDNETKDNSKGSELQLLSFNVIADATKNFSESNMIGKGGFGLVYKGQLPNGQEIAVKRLSMNFGQGIDEFKNEVTLIAKLQHKNLVRLLDFGMARIFGGNQTQANTNRVVGTYGYMSPEYAMDGLFSIKSDIFSFGVILLEIISGRRNNYYSDCRSMNLIGHVWELWKEDRILELIDSSMSISTSKSEVLRCIQVGLLCVQEKAIDRPNMSSVIYMLSDEKTMPSPKQPAFSFWEGNYSDHPQSSTYWKDGCSRNEITITE